MPTTPVRADHVPAHHVPTDHMRADHVPAHHVPSDHMRTGDMPTGHMPSEQGPAEQVTGMDISESEYRQLIGNRVRVGRFMRRRTQETVAAQAGVSRNFVSAIERGTQRLDAYRLRRVAMVLGIDMAELLASEDRRRS